MDPFTTIEKMLSAGKFSDRILSIRFPFLKNLSPDLLIDFPHPITALIGPNGTNKSTILRALQGGPKGGNLGNYWYDTPLDPIREDLKDNEGRPRYIYTFNVPKNGEIEVLQQRTNNRARGADYWETYRPRPTDGMEPMPEPFTDADKPFRGKTRWKPIQKETVYIDFRAMLPAYDILMSFDYHNDRAANELVKKKRRIRTSSPHIKKALEGNIDEHVYYSSQRIIEPAYSMSRDEVKDVSTILGREYKNIKLLKHQYYQVAGYTAYMESVHQSYSEAFAGSGEFAAIMIVKQISTAAVGSLVLLDEPETSLHPGAQTELLRYLAVQVKKKRLQIVMATHSPSMVEELPDISRKLLSISEKTGKVEISNNAATRDEAFVRVGMDVDRRTIIVEDKLAKSLVERAARLIGPDYFKSIDVQIYSGGADTILKQLIPVNSLLESNILILLDGDQRPVTKQHNAIKSQTENGNEKAANQLRSKLPTIAYDDLSKKSPSDMSPNEVDMSLTWYGITPESIPSDGGNDKSNKSKLANRLKSLEWVRNHLEYLPTSTDPDSLLLEMCGLESLPGENSKDTWQRIVAEEQLYSKEEFVPSERIFSHQDVALTKVDLNHRYLKDIKRIIAKAFPKNNGNS